MNVTTFLKYSFLIFFTCLLFDTIIVIKNIVCWLTKWTSFCVCHSKNGSHTKNRRTNYGKGHVNQQGQHNPTPPTTGATEPESHSLRIGNESQPPQEANDRLRSLQVDSSSFCFKGIWAAFGSSSYFYFLTHRRTWLNEKSAAWSWAWETSFSTASWLDALLWMVTCWRQWLVTWPFWWACAWL